MQSEYKTPVFAFPHKLRFILDDKVTHKQVLTLYNPYDFPIKYRVLGTSPEKYSIYNPEGTVFSRYRADIVIRHNAVSSSNCDTADRFRIQIYDKDTKQVIGKSDVQSIIIRSRSDSPSDREGNKFKFIEQKDDFRQGLMQSPMVADNGEVADIPASSTNYVLLTIAIICIAGLFLPTEKEDASSFFGVCISISLKLIFSYVLGLVTMGILKPQ